jgi:hypothetical protein
MNYELAQELKDAEFPNIKDLQHRQGREFILPDGSVPVYSLGDAENVKGWFVPILEELIEACEKRFDRLLAYHDTGDWEATSEKDSDGLFKSASGKTPTEAIARLWLALHSMKNEDGIRDGPVSASDTTTVQRTC